MSKNEKNNLSDKIQINWYPGHMAKTKRLIKENLDKIDVVYEMIDSRIPISSKVKDLDEIIKNKPRILIFSKYDLCDKMKTKEFINYYEKQGYNTISMDLEHNPNIKPLLQLTNDIMKKCNEKRESKGMLKKRTRVLVVGIPNVGKSTLINRLVGKKAVSVGNKPGITKSLDWIRINEQFELLDTPGILWPKFDNQEVAFNLATFTAIKEEILPYDEVVFYILKSLQKYYPDILKERYSIEEVNEDNFEEVLTIIGKKRGCLVKGGQVDFTKVYTVILNDIKLGSIKNITFDKVLNE